jgi:hypothetical protein
MKTDLLRGLESPTHAGFVAPSASWFIANVVLVRSETSAELGGGAEGITRPSMSLRTRPGYPGKRYCCESKRSPGEEPWVSSPTQTLTCFG